MALPGTSVLPSGILSRLSPTFNKIERGLVDGASDHPVAGRSSSPIRAPGEVWLVRSAVQPVRSFRIPPVLQAL